MDSDGTRDGYDNELNRLVAERVPIPIIASGGAENWNTLEMRFYRAKPMLYWQLPFPFPHIFHPGSKRSTCRGGDTGAPVIRCVSISLGDAERNGNNLPLN